MMMEHEVKITCMQWGKIGTTEIEQQLKKENIIFCHV